MLKVPDCFKKNIQTKQAQALMISFVYNEGRERERK